MNKEDIVNNIIQALKKNISIELNWESFKNKGDGDLDGSLNLFFNEQAITLFVEIKKDVKNHQIISIIKHNNRVENFLLVAENLVPKIKEELRRNSVNYLESNGNAFICNNGVYLYIDTNKHGKSQKEKGNRAFTKTGLKVQFQFLLQPLLLNQTQRDIAEVTKVALGNIPLVINGLLDANLILKLSKNEYVINNYERFLNKWVMEYEQTLKPILFRQRFRFFNGFKEWKKLPLNPEKSVWGGEPAGDLLTNHLRPEKYILYTNETIKELVTNYKLIPDDEGEVWAYEMFWINTNSTTVIAPKELVYADLIIEGDKRNLETAKIIFDEFIKPNI